jgi:hypothetical protein
LDKINNWESKKLGLAEEKAKFYERPLGLQDSYVKLLEWSDAEKAKKIEVLEKEYQDVLDLNRREYEEAQQEVDEHQKAHFTCLEHYLDLWHLCGGKFMEDLQEPIDHTKLLGKWGYKIKHFRECLNIFCSRLYIRPPLSSADFRRTSGRPSEWRSHRMGTPSGLSAALLVRCGMYFPLGALVLAAISNQQVRSN